MWSYLTFSSRSLSLFPFFFLPPLQADSWRPSWKRFSFLRKRYLASFHRSQAQVSTNLCFSLAYREFPHSRCGCKQLRDRKHTNKIVQNVNSRVKFQCNGAQISKCAVCFVYTPIPCCETRQWIAFSFWFLKKELIFTHFSLNKQEVVPSYLATSPILSDGAIMISSSLIGKGSIPSIQTLGSMGSMGESVLMKKRRKRRRKARADSLRREESGEYSEDDDMFTIDIGSDEGAEMERWGKAEEVLQRVEGKWWERNETRARVEKEKWYMWARVKTDREALKRYNTRLKWAYRAAVMEM